MVFIVEAVVGALLAAACQGLFERAVPRKNVTEFLVDKFMPDHGNSKNLFLNLKTALHLVEKALSDDAVEKQLTSQTNRKWVELLTDAVNQIADLLDEINYKVLAESQSSGSPSIDESALHKIIQNSKGELEKMTKTLKDIAEHKDFYGSKESSSKKKSSRLESTSLLKSEVHGRDEDKEKIRSFLMEDFGQRNGEDIPIIAIIGMTGIGKTTLAQLLFNDFDVKSCFSPRAWVHISDGMDVKKVTKTLYDKVTSRTSDTTNFDTLQCELAEKLKDKQFLFVFDDVCNEHHDKWDELQKVLKNGAPKSRIIVTTQSKAAASKMRARRTHHLQPLNVEACWSVFAKKAFEGTSPDAPPTPQEIWKKCGGLPLVARELGILYYEVRAKEWERILNGNLFDLSSNILARFRLSFNHLSSHFLKQCFAYCSIIPKGYAFDKEKLILWWMAQGFLLQLKCGETMEDVGDKYFQELLTTSFFQQASDDNNLLFKMHDLINELAQFASTVQSCLVEKGKSLNISDKTRHVSYVCEERHKEADLVDVLRKAKFLWTFLPLSLFSSSIKSSSIGMEVVKELRKQKRLRVLSLSYQEAKLPDGFGRLQHLRYLDLSDSLIKELPKALSRLYTLQTLILSRCLKLKELPKKMANLINLGHLDLTATEALEMMPPAFGKLKSLQVLTTFVVSNNPEASSIRELGELLHLSGKLSIFKLQNVRDNEDAESAKLKEKKDIKELEFKWSCNGQHDQEEVLKKLRPHEHIEKLSIEGYGGTRLPYWLGDSLFSKMVILRLRDCRNCSTLPSLAQLSSLQQLHVRGMPNCKQWLSSPVTGGGYLSLQELYVENCEELTAIPNNLTSLKILHISTCRQLKFDDFVGYELEELYVQNCEELTAIPNNLTSLKVLFIDKCRQLKFDDRMGYEKLQNLHISSCDCLKKLTLNFYRELESLQIHDCKDLSFLIISDCPLQTLDISDCPLQTLDISDCPKLELFRNGGLPLSLQILTIKNCDKLTSETAWGLRNMKSLAHLKIDCACDGVTIFPDDGLLPASLTNLQIMNFKNLKTLNLSGLQDLISLKELLINCDQVEILSGGILPSSLFVLSITGCASLTDNCKRVQGKYWDKISHIPRKRINGNDLD